MIAEPTTLAQLRVAAPPSESLWHYLAQLPFTLEANILYGLCLGGALGVLVNYFTKWARNEISGSLWAYMFIDHPRQSWLAFATLFAELVGEVAANLFVGSNGGFVGWAVVLLSGFKSGYTIDNLLNKGARPAWTPEERAAKGAQP